MFEQPIAGPGTSDPSFNRPLTSDSYVLDWRKDGGVPTTPSGNVHVRDMLGLAFEP